jgi:asparagine synthase (glutamine-hydrolysing)
LPGELLTYSNGEIRKKRWWKICFSENDEADEKFVKERILALLEDATRLRMRSDVPFGAYLSGGVDSSTIVALMTRFSDKPIKTFSLGYEDDLKNKEADLYHARRVSQTFKTEHYEYIMSYKELIDEIENVIRAFDQPFSGTVSTYFLTKLIRRHVKVALSGDAADELFGSYLSHRVAQPMYHFNRLYGKIKEGVLTEREKELFRPCDIHFLEDLHDKSRGNDVEWRYQLSLFKDVEKDRLLSGEFKSRLNGTSSFSLYQASFQDTTSKDPLNRILEIEWNTQLPDQVLAFVDFLSMAHSVEIRSPFLDYRLVEFVATIPGNLKIRNGNVKDILKRTVEPLIPQGITDRPKEGFVLPIFDWMVEKLKDYCISMLSKQRLEKHGLLDTIVVDDILNRFYCGDNQYAGKVWNLTMFQLWWENYFG